MTAASDGLEAASKGERSGALHGSLLALRYTVEAAPWADLAVAASRDLNSGIREWVHELVTSLHSVARITLPVLSLQEDAYVGE